MFLRHWMTTHQTSYLVACELTHRALYINPQPSCDDDAIDTAIRHGLGVDFILDFHDGPRHESALRFGTRAIGPSSAWATGGLLVTVGERLAELVPSDRPRRLLDLRASASAPLLEYDRILLPLGTLDAELRAIHDASGLALVCRVDDTSFAWRCPSAEAKGADDLDEFGCNPCDHTLIWSGAMQAHAAAG